MIMIIFNFPPDVSTVRGAVYVSQPGVANLLFHELSAYKITFTGVCEVRWKGGIEFLSVSMSSFWAGHSQRRAKAAWHSSYPGRRSAPWWALSLTARVHWLGHVQRQADDNPASLYHFDPPSEHAVDGRTPFVRTSSKSIGRFHLCKIFLFKYFKCFSFIFLLLFNILNFLVNCIQYCIFIYP